jgi:hypothetical protein
MKPINKFNEDIEQIHFYILKSLRFTKGIKKNIRLDINETFSKYLVRKFKLNNKFKLNKTFLKYFQITKERVFHDIKCMIDEDTFSLKVTKSKRLNSFSSKPILSIRFIRFDETVPIFK